MGKRPPPPPRPERRLIRATQPDDPSELVYEVSDLCSLFGATGATVRGWIRRGEFKPTSLDSVIHMTERRAVGRWRDVTMG